MERWSVEGMLSATLSYAVTVLPYYRSLRSSGATPCLERFPIIDSDTIAAAPDAFYHLTRFPDCVLTTGGSTGGAGKFFIFNYDELNQAFQPNPPPAEHSFYIPETFGGVALCLTDLQHGLLWPPSHGQPVISLPLDAGRHLRLVLQFLRAGLVVRDCRYPVIELFGSITKLRALTAYCEHHGLRASDFELRRIVTGAFHASQYWTERLRTFWEADVVVSYGLTEFVESAAASCPGCAGLHFPPTVYSEYRSPDLREPVEQGPAALVLTSLYPFRRAMPLIRYDTGDIVDVLPRCPLTGKTAFRFLGRRSATLFDPSNPRRVLLASTDVLDVLDGEFAQLIAYDDAVATVMSWGSETPASVFGACGYPALNIEIRRGAVAQISITLEAADGATEGDLLALGGAVRTRLHAVVSTRASRPLQEDLIHITCVPKGALSALGVPVTLI